jgi:hypothetical protein
MQTLMALTYGAAQMICSLMQNVARRSMWHASLVAHTARRIVRARFKGSAANVLTG